MKPLVLVTDYVASGEIEETVFGDEVEVRFLNARSEEDILPSLPQADALLVFHEIAITEKSLARLERCKGIVREGVGVDRIDLKGAGAKGIIVCNVPDYGTEEVADHTLMLMLASVRRLGAVCDPMKVGAWQPMGMLGTPRLRGKTLGIVGCGRIGSAMALRAKPLGLRVMFYDPYQTPGHEKMLGVERVGSLEELLSHADILSLHCPHTPETEHLLRAETIALLPEGCVIVNTARGPLIDLPSLLDALDQGHIAWAGLDVMEREPMTDHPVDLRLRTNNRVTLTPHCAYYSIEAFHEMRAKAAREALRLVRGETVINPVNTAWLVNPRGSLPRREALEF